MTRPSSDLAREFPIDRVLQVLEVPPPTPAFVATRCPICRKDRLLVYHDYQNRTDWVHCRSCLFAGDPIELASRAWQVDIGQAIDHLIHGGASRTGRPIDGDRISAYRILHVEYRQRLNAFWLQAQQTPAHCWPGSIVRQQREIFQGRAGNDLARWFVGMTTTRDVEDLFHPGSFEPANVSIATVGVPCAAAAGLVATAFFPRAGTRSASFLSRTCLAGSRASYSFATSTTRLPLRI